MEHVEMLFTFVGGLGMFLYGMNVMADGLQKSADGKMKNLLGFLTKNRVMGILVGALVTAIIQSSSATTVMVVGFVNAGIINLTQAVGVIMGANIGTTITAWIVSMNEWGSIFKPEFFAPLFIGIGAFAMLFSKKEKVRETAEILIGFGVLFIGLAFMSDAIKPYRDSQIFADAFSVLGHNPILGVLAGLTVTAVIQSSSASVGILQTLAANGIVTWNSAIYVTLGQNIGTCVTALLSSLGAQRTAKRAAIIHLLFNAIGTVIFGIIMFVFFTINKAFAASEINSVQISIFHTIFNISNTLLLFPFANKLVTISGKIVKEKLEDAEDLEDQDEAGLLVLPHLDERILESPTFALQSVQAEVVHMGEISIRHAETVFKAVRTGSQKRIEKAYKIEETMNEYERRLIDYLAKLSRTSLTDKQHLLVSNLVYTVSDIERMSDHCDNIAELMDNVNKGEAKFSLEAVTGFDEISELAIDAMKAAVLARKTGKAAYVQQVVQIEDEIDELQEELREKHISRLAQNQCTASKGVLFLDMLSDIERISDHAYNIVGYVADENENN